MGTKFFIQQDGISRRVTIYAIEHNEGIRDQFCLTFDNGSGLLEKHKLPDMYWDNAKPILVLPDSLANELFTEIINQREKLNIKPKQESFTEGKLTAVQDHLKDMQKIVGKLLKLDSDK